MEKKIIERWRNDPAWKLRWERIVLWIFSEDEIVDIAEDMEYTPNGYLDLRGFPFNAYIAVQEHTNFQRDELLQNSGGPIANKRFEKIDFSYADLSGRLIEKCKFYDCLFENTMMRDIAETKNIFVNCVFRKGTYGGSLGMGESSYRNVQFQSVKMQRTQMWWPDFEDCLFQNCNLKGTDFGGGPF